MAFLSRGPCRFHRELDIVRQVDLGSTVSQHVAGIIASHLPRRDPIVDCIRADEERLPVMAVSHDIVGRWPHEEGHRGKLHII